MSSAETTNDPGRRDLELSKQEGFIRYSGMLNENEIDFYFNLANKKYSFETKVLGKEVIVVCDLKKPKYEINKVLCIPKWAIKPKTVDGKFENISGEKVRLYDLSKDQIDFEGCTLTLNGNKADLEKINSLEEEENYCIF